MIWKCLACSDEWPADQTAVNEDNEPCCPKCKSTTIEPLEGEF